MEHIIQLLITYNMPHLFPDDIQKKMALHQDSAPSGHVEKDTMSFMKEHNINVHEWLPKSPYSAPMDYSIWDIMKERVRKHKMSTLKRL